MSIEKSEKWSMEGFPISALQRNVMLVAPETAVRLIQCQFRLHDHRRSLIQHSEIDEIAWQILLDLYLGHLEGKVRFVSTLCSNTFATPSTSLRRLESLIEAGMAARREDHSDQRRVPVVLTALGLEIAQTHIVNVYREFSTLYQ